MISGKQCPKCKRLLLSTAFQRDRTTPTGLYSWCRECALAKRKPRKLSHIASAVSGDPIALAWAGGIIDGEGCTFSSYRSHRRGRRHSQVCQWGVTVANTDERIIIELARIASGGKITYRAASEHRRETWIWRRAHSKCAPFLKAVLPYLVAKREQADLALELNRTLHRRGSAVSEAVRHKRYEIVQRMAQLKRA